MKAAITCLFVISFYVSSAQFMQNVEGKPYLQKALEDYEGSPLLFQAWVKANVTASNGKTYPDMLVNIDIVQDQPIFLSDGKVFTFSETINEFTITGGSSKMTFKRGKQVDQNLPDALMEVLSESPVLFKKQARNLVEVPTYGSSNKTYRYAETKTYYAFINNEYQKITLSKENFQSLFAKNWKEVETYAKKDNISFKNEEGWRSLIKYFQSIK